MGHIKWGNIHTEYIKQPNSNKRKRVEATIDQLIYTIGKEIHFTAEINKLTIEQIIKEMTTIIHNSIDDHRSANDKLTITYVVDSPGGDVIAILKFVDFIRLAKTKYPYIEFVSIITGLVASAGTIMCIVADKRYMTKYAHAMIHELTAGKMGKYTHLISHTSFLTKLHEMLMEIYLDGSKKGKDELPTLMKNETWFSAKEYLEHGFIDDIK